MPDRIGSRPLFALGLACAALLALGASCSPQGGGEPAAQATADARSPVVAEVNGREVTLAELDSKIAPQLYEARSEALGDLVNELVLETEAEKRGVSVPELVAQETARQGPVGDEEVAAFFEQNKERMRPGETLENIGPQIRAYLERERQIKALEDLRNTARISVKLEAPRHQVAATGPSLGPADAPVTIIEFSDYQCPFCSRAEATVKQVLERYPDQVRLVHRHFPLDSIHPQARPAAVAAVCAEEQGRFWDFHEKLFANQRNLGPESFVQFARELGLDVDAFEQCLKSDAAQARVAADARDGAAVGVTGTPAFFINGVKLSGARPFEDFQAVIEAELGRRAGAAG